MVAIRNITLAKESEMYRIERSGGKDYTIEIWSWPTGKPARCVCLLPADAERKMDAERLAGILVREANRAEAETP